jgi:hypothetical protein
VRRRRRVRRKRIGEISVPAAPSARHPECSERLTLLYKNLWRSLRAGVHPPFGAKFRIIDDATRREIPPSCPGSFVATSARTGQDVRDDAPGEGTTIADRVVRPSDRHPERFAGLNVPISGRTWQSGGISLPAERFAPNSGCARIDRVHPPCKATPCHMMFRQFRPEHRREFSIGRILLHFQRDCFGGA